MKKIFLLRHAKSSWKDQFLNDFERPLNKRGKRDAPLIAEQLRNRNIIPDLIISSSSKRTFDTAKIFAKVLEYKSDILRSDKLYEASSFEILNHINKIDDAYNNIIVVCHNPGITNLVNFLSDFSIENIPTAGIVGFSFDKSWSDIKEKSCAFLFFDYPKKYLG